MPQSCHFLPLGAQSGRGLPHSKTLRVFQRLGGRASVLDCGSPLPLWHAESPREGRARAALGSSAFTLIELILVMFLLTVAVSFTAPTLASFFRGRTLDSEARRLLALTHAGQSRAVSEGLPIDLWVDAEGKRYGLEAEPTYDANDTRKQEYPLDSSLQIEAVTKAATAPVKTLGRNQVVSVASVPKVSIAHPALPTIRFLPDGTIAETSPQKVHLTGRDGASLWVRLASDRLSYEISNTDKSL